jgi:hypothetical protein
MVPSEYLTTCKARRYSSHIVNRGERQMAGTKKTATETLTETTTATLAGKIQELQAEVAALTAENESLRSLIDHQPPVDNRRFHYRERSPRRLS